MECCVCVEGRVEIEVAARPPRCFFLVRCSNILSDFSPSTDRSPAYCVRACCPPTRRRLHARRARACCDHLVHAPRSFLLSVRACCPPTRRRLHARRARACCDHSVNAPRLLRPPAGSRSRFHCGHPATSQVLLQLRAQHTCEVWVVELDDPNPRQSTQRERVRVVVG